MCAKLLEIDLENNGWKTLIDYRAEGENYPDGEPNSIFVSSTIYEEKIYLCTSTELFVYSYPELKLLASVSYPFFQNLHHVLVHKEQVVVVSTGLDLIVFLDKLSLEPVGFKHAMGKDPWHKYSQDVDYRKFVTLKPHESHPNFAFPMNDALWVTRFNQKDAVAIDNMNDAISIDVERVHDGYVHNEKVYFTSVNGCVAIADCRTRKLIEVIDLNEIENSGGPLGWCRGLLIEGDIAYVAFSKIRDTKAKENLKWALGKFRTKAESKTKVAVYDLAKKTKLAEMLMPANSINAIYSVLAP